jgi:tetratricopeptide (TPR) repeat protein
MKATTFLTLFALITPLAAEKAQKEDAPPAAPAEAKKEDLLPNQQAFLNLPEERRKEFIKHLEEANRVFQQKRIFETMEEVDKAAAIFKDSPELHNLRGSCYVEMRSFDKALAEFKKAAAFAKDNPSINFNIGEIYFVTKEWQKANDVFEGVLEALNASKQENNPLMHLVEFKVLLCKKKLGLKDEVAKLAEKHGFLDDSPYYYFAQAALAYDDKNLVKAEEWLAMASRIFRDPNILAPWQDTLVEYGYIKSFYGEEAVTEE